MAGIISSVNLIAGAGILGNVGGVPLAANSTAVVNIASFDSLGVITQFANVKSSGNLVLSLPTMVSLNNLAGNIFPVVTNAVPSSYISNLGSTTVSGFTSLISTEINNIMGNGDVGKFDQVLSLASAYTYTTNQLISSAVNANNTAGSSTYISQDNTLTGGISQITQAFSAFGRDLAALGTSISLENLPGLGSPQALLTQIYTQTHGSAELNTALAQAGIGQSIIGDIENISMTDEQQKIVFDVMASITGSSLTQILKLLKVTTPGLTNLSELLNPVKAFPLSYNTLTAPTVNGIRGIYINSSGAVNSKLETELPSNVLTPLRGYQTSGTTYSQLKKIIPPDWALANKALQAGFEQIKSVFNSSLPALAIAVTGLESNRGLNLINTLSSPLPTSVSDFYKNSYASGTGTDGTLLLADVIGSAGGWVVNGNLSSASSTLTTLTSAGALVTLTNNTNGLFTVMQNVIDGVYGDIANSITIPGGLPGAGTYADGNAAFTSGLIPAGYSLIGTIVTNNSSAAANANSNWSNIAAQLLLESTTQSQAQIVFANLIPGTSASSLVNNLTSYGLETAVGGGAWFLESVANTSTLGGQAIISTMREARNQVLLQNAGISTDSIVDDIVVEPQISISAGQYTASEAASQKII